MAGFDDKELALACVYSDAMLGLAEAAGLGDALRDELIDLAEYIAKSPEFATFFSSPMLDVKARQETLERLFRGQYSDLFVDSLQVLNRKERLGLLPAVAETYRLAHEDLRGRVEVYTRTAAPLTDEHRARLREVIAEHTGRVVDLVETVDDDLLGGLIVQIGDEKCDITLSTQLARLGKRLMDRASEEIHGGRGFVESAGA